MTQVNEKALCWKEERNEKELEEKTEESVREISGHTNGSGFWRRQKRIAETDRW